MALTDSNVITENRTYGYLDLWDAVAGAVPERECIVQGDRRLSWAQVADRSTRLGWWLTAQGLGVRPGPVADWESPNDLVGLLMRNSPEYLESSLAGYRARCAPFNVNHRYQGEELAYLVGDARPSVMVYHLEFGPVLSEAIERSGLPAPRLVHVDDDSGNQPLLGSVPYEHALSAAEEPDVAVVPSPDDCHVLYTGGTTGMPRGVIWRQRELAGRPCGISIASLKEAASGAPRREWLRAFPAPPLMHGTASWFSYGAWARGGCIVLSQDHSFDAARALELCRTERVAWIAIVGDAFAQPILRALAAGEDPPSEIAYVFSSGAVLSPNAWAELDTYFPGLKLVNALGSSETGPQAFQTSSKQAQFAAGPDTYVVSEDYSHILSASSPGTGWLSNAGDLPRGYLNDEVRTAGTFRVVEGKRLSVSGDLASVDGSGAIMFLGRGSGVINSGGEKIYAEEVEGVLKQLPEIADAVVVGRASEKWGQEVVAVLVSASGDEVGRDEIRSACADRLAGYKLPKTVVWVPSIHRHANGKVDHAWVKGVVEPQGDL